MRPHKPAAAEEAGAGCDEDQLPVAEILVDQHLQDPVKVQKVQPVSFLRLFSHARAVDWLLIGLGALGAIVNGCALPLFALAFGSYTTEGFSTDNALPEARKAALNFVYLSGAVFVAFYLQAACWMRSGSRQASSMRIAYLRAIMRQDVAFFETQTTTGALLQGLNEDTNAFQRAISERLGIFIQHTATFVVGFALAFWRGWEMTLVLLGCLPLLGAVGLAISKLSAHIDSRNAEAYALAQDLAQQAISQVRTVAAFGTEQETVDKYDSALALPEKVGIKQGLLTGLSLGSLNLVLFSAYAASLYYGATRVAAGAMQGGDVLAVMMSALLGAYSLGQAAPILQVFQQGKAAGARLLAVHRLKPVIDANAPGKMVRKLAGDLKLRNVSFSYPTWPVPVLENVNLHIPAGQTVALVGSSGSGKTTIVALLQRFYDPTNGAVLLDNVDIRRLQLKWLRSKMAFVSQETSLFATTIYENIAMGRPDATKEEVLEAARAALVDSFVNGLPLGYDTHVGSRGITLSGGQRQRISIARAILKKPRILLLDEATSALDSASEATVSLALQHLAGGASISSSCGSTVSTASGTSGGRASSCSGDSGTPARRKSRSSRARTVIMVAHRLSTVRSADSIVVLTSGKVAEQGTHDELMAKPQGTYASLVALQNRPGVAANRPVPPINLGAAEDRVSSTQLTLDEQDSYYSTSSSSSNPQKAGWINRLTKLRRRSSHSSRTSNSGAAGKDIEIVISPTKDRDTHAASPVSPQQTLMVQRPLSPLSSPSSRHSHSHPQCNSPVAAQAADKTAAAAAPAGASAKQPSAFWWLLGLVKSEFFSFAVGALGCIGHGSMMPAFAALLVSMLAVFQLSNSADMLRQAQMYSMSLAAVGFGTCCCVTVQFYMFGSIGTKLARRLRVLLLGAILRQEIGWHDAPEHAPGKMTSLLATDATSARGAVADIMGLVLQCVGALGFGYAVAFMADWRVALVVTALLPILVSGAVIQTRYLLGTASGPEGSTEGHAAATAAVTEALAAIHVVQAYNLQDRVCSMYRRMLDTANRIESKACHVSGLSFGYSQASMFIVIAIVVYFGGLEVSSGRANFEQMMKAFLCIEFAAMGVAQALVSFPEIGKAGPAVQRMMALLQPRQPQQQQQHGQQGKAPTASPNSSTGEKELSLVPGGRKLKELKGHVQLLHVFFSYPTRPHVHVLQNFSLDIPAGSTIAIVGQSGSGKSTVISLLQRFYEPDSGALFLDGVDIRSLDLAWLRKQMGLVSQECLLFHGTVEDNIRYGCEGATSQQVVEAAKAAFADEFIKAMPQGYKTWVGGRGGIKFSGGQRQRIAIARAIIRNPKILLLDEATSALDAASEAIVTRALNDLAASGKPHTLNPGGPSGESAASSSPRTPWSGVVAPPLSSPRGVVNPALIKANRPSLGGCSASSIAAASAAAADVNGSKKGSSSRTTIIVAHRFATITAADTIAVLSHNGQLLEAGSPAELLGNNPNGPYAKLMQQQMQHATPFAAASAALPVN